MSALDLITRCDTIINKYGRYDEVDKEKPGTSSDPFNSLYTQMKDEVASLQEKAAEIEGTANKVLAASLKAEIRRGKNSLLTYQIPRLDKLGAKRIKGMEKDALLSRQSQIKELIEDIKAIPDGIGTGMKKFQMQQSQAALSSLQLAHIALDDFTDGKYVGKSHEQTDQSRAFREEYEVRRDKQDKVLDEIEKGVTELKNIGLDMTGELERQQPLVNEIESKVDNTAETVSSQNVRMKEVLTRLRSSRNFCVDMVLISILLGVGAYIYSMVK